MPTWIETKKKQLEEEAEIARQEAKAAFIKQNQAQKILDESGSILDRALMLEEAKEMLHALDLRPDNSLERIREEVERGEKIVMDMASKMKKPMKSNGNGHKRVAGSIRRKHGEARQLIIAKMKLCPNPIRPSFLKEATNMPNSQVCDILRALVKKNVVERVPIFEEGSQKPLLGFKLVQ